MKPLSIYAAAVTALFLFCTSFSVAKEGAVTHKKSHAKDDMHYWWYDPSDNFTQFARADIEIASLEVEFQVVVDQNSFGGTLLAEGYTDPTYPHDEWPDVLLYGHF